MVVWDEEAVEGLAIPLRVQAQRVFVASNGHM